MQHHAVMCKLSLQQSEGRRDHCDHLAQLPLGFLSGIPAWGSTVSVAKETIINLFHPSPPLSFLSILSFLLTMKNLVKRPSPLLWHPHLHPKDRRERVERILGREVSPKLTSYPWILYCRWMTLWKRSSQQCTAYQMLYCLANTRHISF